MALDDVYVIHGWNYDVAGIINSMQMPIGKEWQKNGLALSVNKIRMRRPI